MSASFSRMSRRDFLRTLAIGGGGLALNGTLDERYTSTARQEVNPPVDLTLYTSGWPIDLPLADAQPGTFQAGYANGHAKVV